MTPDRFTDPMWAELYRLEWDQLPRMDPAQVGLCPRCWLPWTAPVAGGTVDYIICGRCDGRRTLGEWFFPGLPWRPVTDEEMRDALLFLASCEPVDDDLALNFEGVISTMKNAAPVKPAAPSESFEIDLREFDGSFMLWCPYEQARRTLTHHVVRNMVVTRDGRGRAVIAAGVFERIKAIPMTESCTIGEFMGRLQGWRSEEACQAIAAAAVAAVERRDQLRRHLAALDRIADAVGAVSSAPESVRR